MKTIKIILSILPFFFYMIGMIFRIKAIAGEEYYELGNLMFLLGAMIQIFTQRNEIVNLKQNIKELQSRH